MEFFPPTEYGETLHKMFLLKLGSILVLDYIKEFLGLTIRNRVQKFDA